MDEDCYSVILLFKDAKMFATGEGLSYEESHILKGKVRLLYGSLFELRNDFDLLALFKLLKDKGIDKFHVDIEVLPLAVEEPEEIYMLESAPLPTQDELDNETDPFPSQYQPETNPSSSEQQPEIFTSPSEQQPETFPTPTEPPKTQTDLIQPK